MALVVLGLGSNRSWGGLSCLQLLQSAVKELSDFFPAGCEVSSVYSSKAMYYEDQDDFHNMAVAGFSDYSPYELLEKIHIIEKSLGRDRNQEFRNGPRSMDIDIELYGTEIVNYADDNDQMKNLQIPHPRLFERAFVLVPMLEVLRKYADSLKVDSFEKNLSLLDCRDLKLMVKSDDFKKMLSNPGKSHGRIKTNRTAASV